MAVAFTLSGVILFLSEGNLGALAVSISRGVKLGAAFEAGPVGKSGVG